MPAHAIVGVQWGDEGKGKIVDFLASRYAAVARFQGGNNAGHTVKVGDQTFKLHLVPSGAVAGVPAAIGNGVVVDPRVLLEELDGLAARDVKVQLWLSPRAHVIMPYHIMLDGASEEAAGSAKIGTTRRGIGPCYTDKVARRGVRVGDLVDKKRLAARVAEVYPAKKREMEAWGIPNPPNLEAMVAEYAAYGKRLKPFVVDVGERLEGLLDEGRNVLLEGAQGILLDIDHGTYPFVTSSSTVAGNATAGTGIGADRLVATLGVAKAYATRVGEGPFPSELSPEAGVGKTLVTVGREVGTTTGRPRRVGWLDLVALKYAIRVAGVTHLAVMKLDVLDGVSSIKVATRYKVGSRVVTTWPEDAAVLAKAVPVYKTFKGWSKSVAADGTLAPQVVSYLAFLQDQLGVPVSIASTGPRRDETVVVASNPFIEAPLRV